MVLQRILSGVLILFGGQPSITSSFVFNPTSLLNVPNKAHFYQHSSYPSKLETNTGKTKPSYSVSKLKVSNEKNALGYDERAREVFNAIDTDNSGSISCDELQEILEALNIPATETELQALFKYLDSDGNGEISFDDEFLPWYKEIFTEANSETNVIQRAIMNRKTAYYFDPYKVSTDVLERAVECAVRAPKIDDTKEIPWIFTDLGNEIIQELVRFIKTSDGSDDLVGDWEGAPGWCVVSCRITASSKVEEDAVATTYCAIQNFILSMSAEDVGTRLLNGEFMKKGEFYKLCNIDSEKETIIACVLYGFAKFDPSSINLDDKNESVQEVLRYTP